MVRFFHRKHECYIVAEGSFAGESATLEATKDLVKSRKSVQDFLPVTVSIGSRPKHRMSYLDPSPDEEQYPKTLGPYSQVVHVEVHEDSDDAANEHLQQGYTHEPTLGRRSRISRSSSCFDRASLGIAEAEQWNQLRRVASESRYLDCLEQLETVDSKVVINDGKAV